MYYQGVFNFDDDDNDPRFSIRAEVGGDAPEETNTVLIDLTLAERQGITTDSQSFPTSESLEAWHRKHNPQLFNE